METIRNYLESMFRGLPQTDKIIKAKSELLQMMEDKYGELIRSGKTENEAVGEVIQNFGNLEDLADDLGIKEILHQTKVSETNRRKLSFDEIKEYLAAKSKSILMSSIGIMLFIISATGPIISDALRINDIFGIIVLFLGISAGVILITLSGAIMEAWRFMKYEPCCIDSVSGDYIKNKNREFTPSYSVMSSVGILLCILCFIPVIILDDFGGHFWEEISGAMPLFFVGAGVFLILYAKKMKKMYSRLLKLNDKVDFEIDKKEPVYIPNKTVRIIMSVYWSVVTCLYICISFVTFRWGITWIIWPIAIVTHSVINAIYKVKEEDNI